MFDDFVIVVPGGELVHLISSRPKMQQLAYSSDVNESFCYRKSPVFIGKPSIAGGFS